MERHEEKSRVGVGKAELERNVGKSRVGVWEGRVGKEYERKTEKEEMFLVYVLVLEKKKACMESVLYQRLESLKRAVGKSFKSSLYIFSSRGYIIVVGPYVRIICLILEIKM